MTLMKDAPFQAQRYEEDRAAEDSRVFTIRLNRQEREQVKEAMLLLRQAKKGTTIKQLMKIGLSNVLHDEKTRALLGIVKGNERRNERLGLPDSEIENAKM